MQDDMNKLTIIRNGIKNKYLLILKYNGHQRIVAPHHYGMLNGKKQLQAFQASGGSKSGKVIGWKNFDIGKIQAVTRLDQHFIPRSDHHPYRAHFSEIEESV